jgi:predicted helicase
MSRLLVQQYHSSLQKLRKVSGSRRESVIREAFKDLLKNWARSTDLTFVPEYEVTTKRKERRYVDGALLHALRVPFGYWEAKDQDDDLEEEIARKFSSGYPRTNIIFEDSQKAILYQNGAEADRCELAEVAALERLLNSFFAYQRPELEAFDEAIKQFSADLPVILEELRSMIVAAYEQNDHFAAAAASFLEHARDAVNPSLVEDDIREMLIQHILTGEVFAAVFPGTTYHEDNSIARELLKLERTFFVGDTRFQILRGLEPYYAAIREAASRISTHTEKESFLKAIYENFYRVYNPKAADRLGVIYTPSQIVRFMVESSDHLCDQTFGVDLLDDDVDILDPATGTGTFICEMLDHFSGSAERMEKKYLTGMFANEVGILPCYVANLNIEATFAALCDKYVEFPGLCFVDTLDNTYSLKQHRGQMAGLFGTVSDDNAKRIKEQNKREISVIIGNPPYNANQLNETEVNKNRPYPEIDKRIKKGAEVAKGQCFDDLYQCLSCLRRYWWPSPLKRHSHSFRNQ